MGAISPEERVEVRITIVVIVVTEPWFGDDAEEMVAALEEEEVGAGLLVAEDVLFA